MARNAARLTLDLERYHAITELAENQERPVAEVVREIFDLGLEQIRNRKQRKIQALEELNALRHRLEASDGTYPGNPVAEARAERERQLAAVLSTKGAR